MGYRIIILGTVLLSSSAWAGMMKCTDSKGNVTFSDSGCASAKMGQRVHIAPTNTTQSPSSRYRSDPYEQDDTYNYSSAYIGQQAGQINAAQQQYAREYEMRQMQENEARMAQFNDRRSSNTLKRVKPDPSAPTTPIPELFNTPAYAAAPPPRVITRCNDNGCWDSQGTRYHKGAGNAYLPSTGGGFCRGHGKAMYCN